MQIAPARNDAQPSRLEQLIPFGKFVNIFLRADLLGAPIQTQTACQESGIRNQNQESSVRLRNAPHLRQSNGLVDEMFERSHAGDEIEPRICERQRFGRTTDKFAIREFPVANLDRLQRQINAGDARPTLAEQIQPVAGATGYIEHLPTRRIAQPFGDLARMPGRVCAVRMLPVVPVVVEIADCVQVV